MPRRVPAATAIVLAGLTALTVLFVLAVAGRSPLSGLIRGRMEPGDRVFYVLAYHYGYAFFDERFVERPAIEVREGETVTLSVVPVQILGRAPFYEYAGRSLARAIGDLPAGDPRIRRKIEEDLALGNVEHIVGIAGHPVYLTTKVAETLAGKPFREGPPRTLEDAVRARDPAIRSVTLTAKRVGSFDVLCVDSGMDGAGTCGWGHKWMTARDAFVVRP
jgi:hypothetical protein